MNSRKSVCSTIVYIGDIIKKIEPQMYNLHIIAPNKDCVIIKIYGRHGRFLARRRCHHHCFLVQHFWKSQSEQKRWYPPASFDGVIVVTIFFFFVENWILFISRYHTEVNIKGKCPLCAVQWWEKFLNFNTYPPVFLVIEKKRSSTELSPIRYVFKDASSSLYYLSRFIYIYFFFFFIP